MGCLCDSSSAIRLQNYGRGRFVGRCWVADGSEKHAAKATANNTSQRAKKPQLEWLRNEIAVSKFMLAPKDQHLTVEPELPPRALSVKGQASAQRNCGFPVTSVYSCNTSSIARSCSSGLSLLSVNSRSTRPSQ